MVSRFIRRRRCGWRTWHLSRSRPFDQPEAQARVVHRTQESRRRAHLLVVSGARRAASAPTSPIRARAPRRAVVHHRASGERALVQADFARARGTHSASRRQRHSWRIDFGSEGERACPYSHRTAIGARDPSATAVRTIPWLPWHLQWLTKCAVPRNRSDVGHARRAFSSGPETTRGHRAASKARAHKADASAVVRRLARRARRDSGADLRGTTSATASNAGRRATRIRARIRDVAIPARSAGRANHRAGDLRHGRYARLEIPSEDNITALFPKALGGAKQILQRLANASLSPLTSWRPLNSSHAY